MYAGKNILGLIPARGGSKGLPGKNIRPLLGKPLLAWTVEQALDSRYIDHLAVSTDVQAIADVAERFGVREIIPRPKKLATDTAQSIDVIAHALQYLGERGQKYDYLVLLEPTSPLRETKDIDRAIEVLVNNKKGGVSIVSIAKVENVHPEFLTKMVKNNRLIPYQKNNIRIKRRQDLSDLYFFEGTLYISEVKELLKRRSFYHDRTLGYVVPRWKSPEVDELMDLLCIETILKHKNLIKKNSNHG